MSVARRLLRIVGSLLSLACIAWVGWRFYATGALQQTIIEGRGASLFRSVAMAIPVYAIAVVVLGFAWSMLQRIFSVGVPFAPSISAYLITQIGKYLPGGVGQYIGRHVVLRRLGMSHASLALCALAETACLVAIAVATSAPFATRFIHGISPMAAVAIVISAIIVSVAIVWWARRSVGWVRRRLPVYAWHWLLPALVLYIVFFLLMSVTLALTSSGPFESRVSFSTLSAVAAASWLGGFLIVGAPAGLGVREAIFVALLAELAPAQDILLVAAEFRLATFGGDIAACLLGLIWTKLLRSHTAGTSSAYVP